MLQYRRIAVFTLGLWIGAAVFADVAVTQNFQTVDRFLESPGTPAAVAEVKNLGHDRTRALLRRNAAEENNFLFENGERAQIAFGIVVALIVAFERRPDKLAILLTLAMTVIVIGQHFGLSPQVAVLGREIDGLPSTDPLFKRFWTLHGIYSGLEIAKLAAGLFLAGRLCIDRSERAHIVHV